MNAPSEAEKKKESYRKRLLQLARVPRISWRDLAASLGPVLLASIAAIVAALHFVRPAPPSTLTMSGGPPGSTFQITAEKYRDILARNGVHLKVLPSDGSQDNLDRLTDPASEVDIALVQAGVTGHGDASDIVSLGSVSYQPLIVFYRAAKPMRLLSELTGKRVAIGGEGSGTRFLALALLKANGIAPGGATELLDLEGEGARKGLLEKKVDAVFLSGDSASTATIREMLHADGVRLYDFVQGDAYERRFRYLSKLPMPAGAFDLGGNLPAEPITLLAPTVELLAHSDLHPALSDLLIDAAHEVHGKGTLLQNPGEFPAPLPHDYPISDDADRYYKTGKSVAYRYLPFWLASLVSRTLVVLLPILVVLIPGLRLVPALYHWRINNRIYKRYGELMAVERSALEPLTSEQRDALLERLGEIERAMISVKMPGAFADQMFVLRQHLRFVRNRLVKKRTVASTSVDPATTEEID